VTSCDDVDLILAMGAVSGGLEDGDLDVVRGHLPGCDRCARAAAEYTATADLMAVAVDQVQPSAELRSRIMAEVYASAPARTRTRRSDQPPRHGWLWRLWRALPSGRGFTLGGALAAAAAVALLVVAVGRGGGGPVSSPVKGTVAEPAVQGAFTYYPQTQTAVLSVHGLPAQPSQVYEVWLVRSSSAVTAAGYLTQQPDGSWSVAIHGSLSGYSTVAATVEPPGGSQTPTGRQVLAGTLPST
jgi:anti-sigma-K factor RskA